MKGYMLISWFINPKFVLQVLGIRKRLGRQDWLSLKQFDFGELGYDYEEGLRFKVPVEKIEQAAQFIRKFHTEYNVPWFAPDGDHLVVATFGVRNENELYGGYTIGGPDYNRLLKKFRPAILKAGFTPGSYGFYLVRSGAVIARRVERIAKKAGLR